MLTQSEIKMTNTNNETGTTVETTPLEDALAAMNNRGEYAELDAIHVLWETAALKAKTFEDVANLCTERMFDETVGTVFKVDAETRENAVQAAKDVWLDMGEDLFFCFDDKHGCTCSSYQAFCDEHKIPFHRPWDHPEPKDIPEGEFWATDDSIVAIERIFQYVADGHLTKTEGALLINKFL